MNAFHLPRGWRLTWLLSTGVVLAIITALAINLFPSRSDIKAVWLRKAVAIEKRFDPAIARMDEAELRGRFMGMTQEEALARIRTKIDRLYPELLIAARSATMVPGGFTSPMSPLQKYTGKESRKFGGSQVVWSDAGQLPTEEALRSLKTEFDELDILHEAKLASLNAQVARLTMAGLLFGMMAMVLAYVLGILIEKTFGVAWVPAHRATASRAVAARVANMGAGWQTITGVFASSAASILAVFTFFGQVGRHMLGVLRTVLIASRIWVMKSFDATRHTTTT